MKFAILAALALAASSSLSAQAPARPPAAVDPQYVTPMSGTWTYGRATEGTQAVFIDASARPQLTLRCSRASRQLMISKPASGAAPFMLVWTSSTSRNVPASFDPATSLASVRLAASDPLLDALAFSRARIAVTLTGTAQLVLPSGGEVIRVIEDCRA